MIYIPFMISLHGEILPMIQKEANHYRGYYYKVEVPAGTTAVQLERYKNIKVQNQNYETLITEGSSTVDLENIVYGKSNYIILNYDMFWYEYIYFVEAEEKVPVESVTLDITSLELQPGQTQLLTATVLPDTAAYKTVTWTSSDPRVASVTNGTVTALKEGKTEITAEADGKTAVCQVVVKETEPAEGGYVTVTIERFTIGQGFYLEPVKLQFEAGQTAMDMMKQLVGENLITNEKSTYISGIRGADLGVDHVVVPSYIPNELDGPTTEEVCKIGNSDDVLGAYDYFSGSGWYYFVNNVAPNVGMADWTLRDGDVIRLQFTLLWGQDLTGTFFGEGEPTVVISNKDDAITLLAEINSREDKETVLADASVKNAYENVIQIVQDAVAPQSDVDAAVQVLKNAMESLPELRKAKEEAKAALASYKDASEYREAEKADLTQAIADGKAAIEAANDVEGVKAALAAAKAVMDAIKTDTQLTAEEKPNRPESPETGDNFPYTAAICLGIGFILFALLKKQEATE